MPGYGCIDAGWHVRGNISTVMAGAKNDIDAIGIT